MACTPLIAIPANAAPAAAKPPTTESFRKFVKPPSLSLKPDVDLSAFSNPEEKSLSFKDKLY